MRERVVTRLVRPLPTDVVAGWAAPAGLFLVTLLVRLHRLAVPRADMFDELYYACEARSLLRHGHEVVTLDRASGFCLEDAAAAYGDFVVHPPLGKWMIALGEALFGFNSFGWRFSAAVAGALSVLMLARIGRRMFGSTFLGCLAGGVMGFDALHFVQSRIAMLDIFLLFWVVAAFGCLVVDRDVTRARLAARLDSAPADGARLGLRAWLLGAGACLGAAIATKWSGLYFLAAFGLLAVVWEVGARRTAGAARPVRSTVRRSGASLVALLLTGGVVYVSSWAGWFASDDAWRRNAGTFDANLEDPDHHGPVRGLVEYHEEIWTFHQGLDLPHGYQSKPESWFLLVRPVAYYYPALPEPGQSQAVLGVGSPAVWWAAVPAFVALGWAWVSRRDWRAAAVLAVTAAGYLPWFLERERTMFFFYALPLLPFMALALAYCAGLALGRPGSSRRRRRLGALAVGLYAGAVVGNFAYLHPILAARVIPATEWSERMLFQTWI